MLETMSNSYILQILLIEYVLMTGILAEFLNLKLRWMFW